jgi:hypothetical protein
VHRWIAQKVVDILATEDDVVIDFIFGMLEEDKFVAHPPPVLQLYGLVANWSFLIAGSKKDSVKYHGISREGHPELL